MSATDRLSAALADRYRIERELGSGGMATVYLAEDLKHKRKVALKVLKPELAAVLGAERFVQEITTTASLQHPHILPLFDSGTADGFLYYVMPFIQGETLRDRLNRETQLGVDDAVKIAVEVADALQYAHEQGVIHRDIKPENILLANGRPMVADFGIALAVSAAAGGRMTETGLSLGTPHYMSPEQATAEKEITARSDVYSLASVLYEMLAGQPPHLGGSAQQIIMKIIAEPVPAVTTLRKAVPPNVAAALAKALEKLPADRFESARAFAGALGNSAFSTPAVATQVGIRPSQDWRSRVALPATGLSIILAAPVIWMVASRPGPAPVSRYEVAWPGTAPLNVNVSPDGSLLVIRSRPDSTLAPLLLKHRDALDATPIPGTAGAYNTAFSPDGGRIAFMVSSNIMTVDVRGGVPLPVMDTLVGSPGLDWGPDGYIYFDRYGAGPLMRVPEGGGQPEAISTLDTLSGELQHIWPDLLPGGRGAIMVVNRTGPGRQGAKSDSIAVLDLRTGRHRSLFAGVYARYDGHGHLLYLTADGNLMAVPFDAGRLTVTGSPIGIEQDVSNISISKTGTLWYSRAESSGGRQELIWRARDGAPMTFAPEVSGQLEWFALSADGAQVAYLKWDRPGSDLWVTRVGTGRPQRLTFNRFFTYLSWHPDNRRILAVSVDGTVDTGAVDASSRLGRLAGLPPNVTDARWSPDGSWLLVTVFEGGQGNSDIFGLRPGIDSTAHRLVPEPGSRSSPSVSPDGHWLLYASSSGEDAGDQILVRPFPATTNGLHQATASRGYQPRWSRDGREIYYLSTADSMMAIDVKPGPTFSVGEERALFALPSPSPLAVTPDGKRFLLESVTESPVTRRRFFIIENLSAALKQMMER